MTSERFSGNQIRQTFIDFFVERGHKFVPSSSLVPGGDQTLLFTNAGMVQFKDVFLGTDKRPYKRATNSQKCMRVAGKHNDLDDVGRDNTHHTFFEMLGNWSFGDYYKKEAIAWAWELLTEVWGLPRENLWATVFKDELGEIPTDEEAVRYWKEQPGFNPEHIFYFGRKENFWEMADTGPCGPNSEVHIDLHPERGPVKPEDLDSGRFVELWNLVFIQYNRSGPTELQPLPAKHVDTGMGFERIVSVLQGVDSNYRTDLLWPLVQTTQKLTGHSDEEREANFTAYRVIADHGRAAAFLIADGVVPGNTGRNYVSRMIIRRAARFGSLIGLQEPFLAHIAETVIEEYGAFYPELMRNRATILESITREESRFQRTVESGIAKLENALAQLHADGKPVLPGEEAFDLYATYGLPVEITRDIARERGLEVDHQGFQEAMEEHRIVSGAGEAFGPLGDEEVEVYRKVLADLQANGKLGADGVAYDPYGSLSVEGAILAIVREGEAVERAQPGDQVEILLPKTSFYVEAGGQVSDTGRICSLSPNGTQGWEIRVEDMRKPAAGIIVHVGQVVRGEPKAGDQAIAAVDAQRRRDIMRNHTATHLLHHELRRVLGEHALQAGSLVAPDRLRFDFTHPEAVRPEQLERIEAGVNRRILENYRLKITYKPLQQAIAEGAMALFGEKYGETVRTITMGEPEPFSYELCGGTHVSETGDIGLFLITSEGSVAAGIRRIEAVTGRKAYELVQSRFQALNQAAALVDASPSQTPEKVNVLVEEINEARKQIAHLRRELAERQFVRDLEVVPAVQGIPVLTTILPEADSNTLRQMADRFRQRYPSGVAVLASVSDGSPLLVAAVTEDLVNRGLHAGELIQSVAQPLGGGGGGRPTFAQAGGRDASRLDEALASVRGWVEDHLKPVD
ncbi:MAG TPA: alanine--tRNA ligase [Anaerolineales bacterium]|nr:alanine--tRNA ligase [Anaerolineales bacterium]